MSSRITVWGIFVLVMITLSIQIQPVQAQSVHEIDIVLERNEFTMASGIATESFLITGNYSLLSGDRIEFFICDNNNYYAWLNEEDATLYEQRNASSGSFEFTPPYGDFWYVVFANTVGFNSSKHVIGVVEFIQQGVILTTSETNIPSTTTISETNIPSTTPIQYSPLETVNLALTVVAGFVLFLVFVVAIIVRRESKSTRKSLYPGIFEGWS